MADVGHLETHKSLMYFCQVTNFGMCILRYRLIKIRDLQWMERMSERERERCSYGPFSDISGNCAK